MVTNPKPPRLAAVEASAYAMRYLAKHLALLMPKNNVSVLTDIDVDGGSIFKDSKNTTNKYDILILGHQEYSHTTRIYKPENVCSKWGDNDSSRRQCILRSSRVR